MDRRETCPMQAMSPIRNHHPASLWVWWHFSEYDFMKLGLDGMRKNDGRTHSQPSPKWCVTLPTPLKNFWLCPCTHPDSYGGKVLKKKKKRCVRGTCWKFYTPSTIARTSSGVRGFAQQKTNIIKRQPTLPNSTFLLLFPGSRISAQLFADFTSRPIKVILAI